MNFNKNLEISQTLLKYRRMLAKTPDFYKSQKLIQLIYDN